MTAAGTWTDSHCHLQDDFRRDGAIVEEMLRRAADAGVARAVCVGTSLESSRQAVSMVAVATVAAAASEPGGAAGPVAAPITAAATRPALWATVGLHPHDASSGLGPVEALLQQVAPAPGRPKVPGSVVGVGECGLDYHYDHSPRDVQRAVFAEQVVLARRLDLTLVVHTRDAWDDTLGVLAEAGAPERTIIHCFTGGPDEARRCLDVGAYVSFSGIVTFKNAGAIRAAAALCPLDRMLVETDAPFLAPVPFRGSANEPSRVPVVGAAVAALRGVEPRAVAEATSDNAMRAYSLDLPAGAAV